MRIEFNGRKIVMVDHFVHCEDCPLDVSGPSCLGYNIFGKGCKTGFKYEELI